MLSANQLLFKTLWHSSWFMLYLYVYLLLKHSYHPSHSPGSFLPRPVAVPCRPCGPSGLPGQLPWPSLAATPLEWGVWSESKPTTWRGNASKHTRRKSKSRKIEFFCLHKVIMAGCFTHTSWQPTSFSRKAFFFLNQCQIEAKQTGRRWGWKEVMSLWWRKGKKKINAQCEPRAEGNKSKYLQTDSSGHEITPEAKRFLRTDLLLDQEI